LDLVICHRDFLNADHEYKHGNKGVTGFGSYGDILIHDRKMYVVPTPFRLIEGVAHQQTLILSAHETAWRDFFNDRQLLTLGWLQGSIARIADEPTRAALLTLFSGVLEFNNLFASYKGEGTGAVRHMFSHHILKPERTPIEANVWGTLKSSGSFSNLFRSRLLRAIEYRRIPTEIRAGVSGGRQVCAEPFTGVIEDHWPTDGRYADRAISLSRSDSATTGLSDRSIDLVVTDPPFFDNVHYPELADFFHSWQQLTANPAGGHNSTRSPAEVQDSKADRFSAKLRSVFCKCGCIIKDHSLLVFTYHHSRDEGWKSLAEALLGAGLVVVNSHPVKAEMSVATPKSQAREPIQLDIIIVCRKPGAARLPRPSVAQATECAREQLGRLGAAGFELSRNGRKVALFGQILTTLEVSDDAQRLLSLDVDIEPQSTVPVWQK
jgi:putative DNA methylase